MSKRAFTMIELLVVLAILGLIIIFFLLAINPKELINRAKDSATFMASQTINNAIYKYQTSQKEQLSSTPFTANIISDAEPQSLLFKLVSVKELTQNFTSYASTRISPLYFTLLPSLDTVNLCFLPRSAQFRTRPDTIYDNSGNLTNCSVNDCYLCINSEVNSPSPSPSGSTPIIEATPSCDNFNPELPDYAYTCNSSSTWVQYGCSNYCVADLGCDSFCPSGSRHLRKTYHGVGIVNFLSCISHVNQTNTDYCVSGTAAHCDQLPNSSSTSDYIWGCTNPTRPYTWK